MKKLFRNKWVMLGLGVIGGAILATVIRPIIANIPGISGLIDKADGAGSAEG